MSNKDLIRVWKNEESRPSLSQEQDSQFSENRAEMMELSDEDMQSVAGGYGYCKPKCKPKCKPECPPPCIPCCIPCPPPCNPCDGWGGGYGGGYGGGWGGY